MAAVYNISEINSALCEALGVDPKLALEITLKITPSAFPEVTVRRMSSDNPASLRDVVERYELRPVAKS